VRAARRSKLPRLRIIFTWMRSNRGELQDLPAFAEKYGASELDVRYVTESPGVDNRGELLSDEDPAALRAELARAAEDAVRRGLKLVSYPEFEVEEELPRNPVGRLARRIWRVRAGIDRLEHLRFARDQRKHGCAYPDRYYVIRPNGAVNPCIYWEGDPIGFYPKESLSGIASGAPLARIRNGLHFGKPVGTCATCSQRRMAFYRLPAVETSGAAASAIVRLPTLPH
jgi:MoaA/NifB/PqqE/SkfB family radical SAM enzyme